LGDAVTHYQMQRLNALLLHPCPAGLKKRALDLLKSDLAFDDMEEAIFGLEEDYRNSRNFLVRSLHRHIQTVGRSSMRQSIKALDSRRAMLTRVRTGANKSAEVKRQKAASTLEWMRAVWDEAYRRLDADCRARVGERALADQAWRVAREQGLSNDKRDKFTRYRAKQYLRFKR